MAIKLDPIMVRKVGRPLLSRINGIVSLLDSGSDLNDVTALAGFDNPKRIVQIVEDVRRGKYRPLNFSDKAYARYKEQFDSYR